MVPSYGGGRYMIIITDEMLLNVFGKERVPFCRDLLMYSLKALIEKEAYGKDVIAITQYESQCNPQEYVDNWMDSIIAKTEVAEYYKELSFKGEDDMNKYETLLKKYQALYKDFETYREVTEDIADKGTYVTNEALAELLDYKKKYEVLKEEQHAYCASAEIVGAKLIETEKKYDELVKDIERLRNEKDNIYERTRKLKEERDDLVKEVYYLNDVINEKNIKCKEKMDKIKQRDKQITKLIDEKNALHTLYTETAKERDNYEKRLDHINAMPNTDWEFVVEETKPTTPYDELVTFCEKRQNGGKDCFGCPKEIACDGINPNYRPAKWTNQQKEDYNDLMDIVEVSNKVMNDNKEDK